MGEDRACKPDEPVMKAWESYRAGPDYANSAQWVRNFTEDSMRAAFSAGFTAGQAPQTVAAEAEPKWSGFRPCNVQPMLSGAFPRCLSCGNTWAASLGVTGCVQGGHGGFAEPRRDGQLPEPEQPGGRVESDWKWLAGENARLRHDAVEAMKAAQAELAECKKVCAGGAVSIRQLRERCHNVEQANERLNSDNARVAGELAVIKALNDGLLASTGVLKDDNDRLRAEIDKAVRDGADQWRGKDRAQMRAGRLWKALKRIDETVVMDSEYLRRLASTALREDAAITAGVEPKSEFMKDPSIVGYEFSASGHRREMTAVDGALSYAGIGRDDLDPGCDECDGLPETVGDAKEFGAAAAKDAAWNSCGCPITAHPMDQCTEPSKFDVATSTFGLERRYAKCGCPVVEHRPGACPRSANKPEKLLNCPVCHRNDGHDPDCIVANPQGSRIRVVDKQAPRMVQIAVMPSSKEIDSGIYDSRRSRSHLDDGC